MSERLAFSERIDRVLVITINRPDKRNAIDRATADALDEHFNLLDDDPDLWCGVLAGNEVAFSAGSDLASKGDYVTERGGEYGIIRRRRRKPLIAAVEGVALGGGMEIALACDLIVAGEGALFGLPEVRRGVLPVCAGLFRAPRALPLNIAMELALTAEPMDAQRAAQYGLVNKVVPRGGALDAAVQMAQVICQNAPVSVQAAREAMYESAAHHEDDDWAATERARVRVSQSADTAEGVRAFFEKRPPVWTGR